MAEGVETAGAAPTTVGAGAFAAPSAFASRAYGLVWRGELPLPGAAPAPHGASTDVSLRRAPLPPPRQGPVVGPFWRVSDDGAAWYARGGAHALVEGGARITVDAPADWPPERLGLEIGYGAAVGLLHQRGALALHASALAGPEGAALFLGAAGAGKSTLVSQLVGEDWQVGGDDLVALEDGPEGPQVLRGLATVKLFADSAAASSGASARPGAGARHAAGGGSGAGVAADRGFGAVVAAGRGFGKAVLPLGPDHEAAGRWPAPLRAVFVLDWLHPPEAPPRLTRLAPMAAFAALRAAIHRPELGIALGREAGWSGALARIAAGVPVHALSRPRRFEAAPAAAALVRAAVAEAALQGAPR